MAASRDPGDASRAMVRRGVGALAALVALLVPTFAAPLATAAPRAVGDDLVVSVVVPLTAPWGDGGILDAETLETATAPTGVLTRELDEVLATTATVALDPMIPASIRLLGTVAPESAVEWLDRLEAASNEVFLLAYADADPTALARADALDLARPLDLEFALDPAAFGPPQNGSPTPDPSGTPAEDDEPPPLPTTEELLAWPDAIGPIAWPADGSAMPDDIAAYVAAGYAATLLGSPNLSAASSALVDIDGATGLVADATASAVLREAASTLDPTARQDAVSRLGLELDRLAAADPGRSVVLTLERTPTFAIPGLAEVLGALAARESVGVTGLSTVLAGASVAATVVEGEPGAATELAPTLVEAFRAEQEFATILTDPMPLVVPRQLALLKLLTVQELEADGWRGDADAYLASSVEIRRSVTIVDTGDVLVTSSNTSMPVRIANALDFAVTVRVEARPLRPILRVDGPTDVTVEPASSATVQLGAQAITNGEVVVEVSISSPTTGLQIGPSHRVNADLQAQWETVGIILGIVVALVFAIGIIRNVVLRRRGSASHRADETAVE